MIYKNCYAHYKKNNNVKNFFKIQKTNVICNNFYVADCS